MKKKNRQAGLFRAMARGSETLGQHTRFTFRSFCMAGLISLGLTIGGTVGYLACYEPGTPSWLWTWIKGEAMCPVQTSLSILPVGNKRPDWLAVNDPKGQAYYPCALVDQLRPWAMEIAGDYGRTAGVIWLIGTATVLGLFIRGGRRMGAEQIERGLDIVEASKFRLPLRVRGPVTLAGVAIPRNTETQHMILQGTPGTGKTTAFLEIMDQIRAAHQRAILYDPTGEFYQIFGRPGTDYLLNPLDARSVHWIPRADLHREAECNVFAEALMPIDGNTDPFWIRAARTMLTAALMRIPDHNVRVLLEHLCTTDMAALTALAQGTSAAATLSPENPRTAFSAQATIGAYTDPLRNLWDSDRVKQEPFSLREWIKRGEDGSWLFLSMPPAHLEATKYLVTAWFRIIFGDLVMLSPSRTRRLWLLIDEFPSLGKMDIFKPMLAQVRKFGVCCVIGAQSYAQLESAYDRAGANSIADQFSTWLTLRTTSGESSGWASRSMGEVEVTEYSEALSYGGRGDGRRLSEGRRLRARVLPIELQELPDLEGYLRITGRYPLIHTKMKTKNRRLLHPDPWCDVDYSQTVYGVLGDVPIDLQAEYERLKVEWDKSPKNPRNQGKKEKQQDKNQ